MSKNLGSLQLSVFEEHHRYSVCRFLFLSSFKVLFLYFPLQQDIFEIGAVDLGKLSKVKIRHDGSGPSSGWKLDKVVVQETETTTIRYVFKYERYAGPKVMKLFSCSSLPSMKFILLINFEMPTITIVGILTFMSTVND